MLKQTNIKVKLSKYHALGRASIRGEVEKQLKRQGCSQEFIAEFSEKARKIDDWDKLMTLCNEVCILQLPKKEVGF